MSNGESAALARVAAKAADEKLAAEIVVLDVGEVLGICDYFVIASARNVPQVKAVVDEIEMQINLQVGEDPIRDEGRNERHWVLLDYGDVVVHVFLEEEREY